MSDSRLIPVVTLAGALGAGQAGTLTSAVIARVSHQGQQVGTVVLDLGDGTDIDIEARRELRALQDLLHWRGTNLRLVITSGAVRHVITTAAAHRISPEMLHPTLRAAVLAAYAELPGPGLVSARVRAALAVPAETIGPDGRVPGPGRPVRAEG